MTTPRRWEPDPNLVECVLVAARSPIPMSHMSAEDRAWLVSGLTLAGVNANEIASMTRCSRRLVMTIRADPCTRVATAARSEAFEIERELRAERCRHGVTRQRVAELEAELSRVRGQRDALVGAAARARASRLRLPREERAEVVASLRESGLSERAIAAATGLGKGTVHRELTGGPNGAPAPDSVECDGKCAADECICPVDDEDALADELSGVHVADAGSSASAAVHPEHIDSAS